jgi:hypothetical protein
MDMVPGHISTKYYHPLEKGRGMVDTKQYQNRVHSRQEFRIQSS